MKIPSVKSTIGTIFAGGDRLLRCMEFCEFKKSQELLINLLERFVFGPSRLPDVTLGKTRPCIHLFALQKRQGSLRLCQMPLA